MRDFTMGPVSKETSILWKKSLMGGTAIISSFMIANIALAQDNQTDGDEEAVEEVVVTGSRIKRDGFSSPAPMDVISASLAAPKGFGDIASMLQGTTIAAGSPQVNSASSTAFVQNGGPGAQTLSLRGLGANRTLVLLNGRRAGPAGVRGSVSSFDMNVLPLSLIDRVEILKDGASSIYGSDAVAGVVNIITKKQDGGEIDLYVSQPERAGGEEYRVNGSWGKTWNGGSFRGTVDYYKKEELAKGQREYFDCGEAYIFDQTTGARADLIDHRTGKTQCRDWGWGHVWTYDYAAGLGDGTTNLPSKSGATLVQYDYTGKLKGFIPSVNELADPNNPYHMRTPEGWYPVNYDHDSASVYQFDHPFQNQDTLIPSTERTTVMAEFEQELTDNMTFYAETLFNRRETYGNHYSQFWSYTYNDNFSTYGYYYGDTAEEALVPAGGLNQGAANEGWTGAQWMSPTPVSDHYDDSQKVDYYRFVAGLKGDFGGDSDWSYDMAFQYSKSDAEYWSEFIYDDAIQSQNNVIWWNGVPGSCVGKTTSVRGIPCIDLPWLTSEFMRGNFSAEEEAFMYGEETGTTIYEQKSFDASATGTIGELPAGSVGMAIGVHYRTDSLIDTPGATSRAGNVWGSSVASITQGEHNTKAMFGEVDIPLLADKPLIELLSLNASLRYTDVSSYGTGTTYKAGLNWQVVPTVMIRATRGTSFRTPALFELYLKDESSFISQRNLDPCYRWGSGLAAGTITQRQADNCAAEGASDSRTASISANVLTGGGFGTLKAETSTSKNIGIIWSPEFADFRISIDYFDIIVNDEVDQLGAANIVRQCYDSPTWPNDPLCSLFDRLPYEGGLTGQILTVRDSFLNIATQKNRGVDIAATYNTEFLGGNLRIDTQHTFQIEDKVELFAGFERDHNGLMGDSKWVGNLNFTLDYEEWGFFWGIRFVGPANNFIENNNSAETTWFQGYPAETTYNIIVDVPTVVYNTFSISRELPNGFTAVLGMDNIFDRKPPQISSTGCGSCTTMGRSAFYSVYNWEGRRAFFNIKKTF
ncbi:MAG: TonB-dependent receptor plug domain-containing protein [Sphingomonadales bacterium]